MYMFTKALLALPISMVCLAEPWFMVHSQAPTQHTPPPEVTGTKALERYYRSRSEVAHDKWDSYVSAHSTEHAQGNIAIALFAVTATYSLPTWATQTYGEGRFVTEAPEWFSELPTEIQSIKRAEGSAWVSILDDKSALAPRETANAAFGVLAGVAIAAAVL
ncbi:hypothetical protein EKO04_006647 [Ascochyta lentis]|uniref:Uncharacterized protein n=1 Tax=Ascochyta lentis TaxID=205686 RepID=A0A8H7J226_9PLEO|nr:hypothetical protein EKO04_006647 [Ascochyta lentis]